MKAVIALVGLVASSTSCLAFAPQSLVSQERCITLSMSSTTTFQPTQSSLEKLDTLKLSIKKPRGASVGVEFSPINDLSDGDLKILSMQLRKSAKAAVVCSADVDSIPKLVKEQESSRGDFPGPLPVIYSGSILDANVVKKVVESDVTAVIVDYGAIDEAMTSLLGDVGIIWKVSSLDELNELIAADNIMGDVVLLSKNLLPDSVEDSCEELADILSKNKSIVTIAKLQSMQAANAEVQMGKHLTNLGVSSLILEEACVGDEEDIKYTAYAIEALNKKSSSSFSMTGLTGSTNGHFGVSSHGGEVKWRRKTE